MTEQLNLLFRGHPVVDSSFRKYSVWLRCNSFDKTPIFVSEVWAKSTEQAIVKAAKIVRLKNYSIPDSSAIPQTRPKDSL